MKWLVILFLLLCPLTANAGGYNDRYNGRGQDYLPPHFRIAPGYQPGHYWRFGLRYVSPDRNYGYTGGWIYFGYEITF